MSVIHCPLCGAAGVGGLIRAYDETRLECGHCRWIWESAAEYGDEQ